MYATHITLYASSISNRIPASHCFCESVFGSLTFITVPQDVCQSLERLKGSLLSLSAGARRLSDKEQAERTVTELNTSYDQNVLDAKDKQSILENLLSLWQK